MHPCLQMLLRPMTTKQALSVLYPSSVQGDQANHFSMELAAMATMPSSWLIMTGKGENRLKRKRKQGLVSKVDQGVVSSVPRRPQSS